MFLGSAGQNVPPGRIIVVADNCTDDTEKVARGHGALVFRTVRNERKKAGALNQALAALLPELADDDLVLVQDDDSTLRPEWTDEALKRVDVHRCVGESSTPKTAAA